VESVFDLANDTPPSPRHMSALAMVITILNSKITIIGLSIHDILGDLLGLVIRRVRLDPRDALLPLLVQCISSLATNIYYADQINDIIEEISSSIADIPHSDKSRSEIVRLLVHAMVSTMSAAHVADEADARTRSPAPPSTDKGKAPQLGTPFEIPRPARLRNSVSLSVWQETLPLLCESAYAARMAYARALLLYLQTEAPRNRKQTETDPDMYRFCHALHAALYTLAISSSLGVEISAPTSSILLAPPDEQTEVSETQTTKGVTFNVTEPTPVSTPGGSGNYTPPRRGSRPSRRVSLPLNRLNSSTILQSFDDVATPFDYAAIVSITKELYAIAPLTALLTGVPMLLALDRDAGTELVRRSNDARAGAWVLERKRAIRETVAMIYQHIGQVWDIPSVSQLAIKALVGLAEPYIVPELGGIDEQLKMSSLPIAEEACAFVRYQMEGETSLSALPLLEPKALMRSVAGSEAIQRSAGRDLGELEKVCAMDWTVETAIKQCKCGIQLSLPVMPCLD
jgi:hypothetical protein